MTSNLETYGQSREVLLTSIITELSSDERCIAAWLKGSYARNNADEVSDLDITVVIAEPYSEVLCSRQEQVSHRTTPERLALFSRFGKPALVHENIIMPRKAGHLHSCYIAIRHSWSIGP